MKWLESVLHGLTGALKNAYGIVVAIAGLAGFAAAGLRWLRRRRQPVATQPIEPVEFSGRTRQAFIERVWAQRIVNGLEHSLSQAGEIQTKLGNAPELVTPSYAQSTAAPGQILAVEAAYEQSGGQLLILGAPGSGKTTQALMLMKHLALAAQSDPLAPVPELFPLASWTRDRKPIIEWLAEQLRTRHGRPLKEGRSLISHHRIAPILDGLDEVAVEHRRPCVEAVNRFWESHRGGPLVLCSRLAEYEQLPERLKLGGAVTVVPPDPAEIDRYLAAAGPRWDGIRADLAEAGNVALRGLLATPLMLNIAVLAYQDGEPTELRAPGGHGEGRDRLWSRYVSAMMHRDYDLFARGESSDPYRESEARRWLSWLAHEMQERDAPELWLHEWTGPRVLRAAVKAGIGVVVALCALIAGSRYLALGVPLGIVAGLCSTPKPRYRRALDERQLLVAGLGPAILIGAVEVVLFLNVGSQLTVIGALIVSGAAYLAVARRVGIGVSAAAIYVLIAFFLFLLIRPHLARGIGLDVMAALLVGLVPGLLAGLTGLELDSERVAPRSPMQPIKDSSEIGLALGVLAGAIGLVLPGRGAGLADRISAGLAVGLVAGVPVGLGCGAFHYAFRFWLRINDQAPFAWVGFLDWASVRLLLRTTGASYQWVHIELRDHLAAGYPDPNPTREDASPGSKRIGMVKVQRGSPRGNGQQSLPVSGGED